MKPVHLSKKAIAGLLMLVLLLTLSACAKNNEASDTASPAPTSKVSPTQSPESTVEPTKGSEGTDKETKEEESPSKEYNLMEYTEAPNEKSSIKIQYPNFTDSEYEAVNAMIYEKVKSFAAIDTEYFSSDTALTLDYQSAVTLFNSKMISLVFWGTSYLEGSAYPTSNLVPLNIDLQSMKEITLKDLYNTNEEFEKVFFEKAYFPTEPVTSYDKESFSQMLSLQSPDYQTVDPFSIADNVTCFLKEDGIVLSLPAVHATGSDHFEAQLNYSDIQQFYLPEQKYWED